MAREETLYELISIVNGVKTSLLSTNDKKAARQMYQKQFRANGTTPRVFVNGVKLTIAEGDKLFIDANEASPWRGNKPTGGKAKKTAPKYTNNPAKIAEEKTRTSQRQPRGGGQV